MAQRLVSLIERDLSDRRGIGQEWQAIDPETQNEIRAEWVRLVRLAQVQHDEATYFPPPAGYDFAAVAHQLQDRITPEQMPEPAATV